MNAVLIATSLARDPRVRVGGLPLVDRALIAAARAGVRRCFVAGEVELPPADRRHPPEVRRISADPGAAAESLRAAGVGEDEPVAMLSADVVFQPAALAHLRERWRPGVAVVARSTRADAEVLPMAVASRSMLAYTWPAAAGGSHGEPAAGVVVEKPPAFAARLRRLGEVAELERDLLLSLENPRDGRVDTILNRKLSRPISRVFLHLGLHPNQITVLSFLASIVAAIGFAVGGYGISLLAALVFQLAAVLDCCDGEVARLRFLESRLGDLLDISLDAVGNAAIFVGIARGVWVRGQLEDAHALGVAAAAGILGTFLVVTYAERRLPAQPAAPAHRTAQKLVGAMTTRDFSIIVLLAAATGALPWFLWGSAIGANVFWVGLLLLLVRGGTARQVGESGET